MEQLLELISDLGNRNVATSEIFKLLADDARNRLGACGMALVCTEGLDDDQYRLLSYVDERGDLVVDQLDFSAPADQHHVHELAHRERLLDPGRPVIHQGATADTGPALGELFKEFIDVASLPILQHDGVHRWALLLFSEPGKVEHVDMTRGLEIATLAINYVFSIETAKRLATANAWIARELKSMRRIQQLLLPQELDDTPGIKVARLFQPHTYVGGDYYEIVPLTGVMPGQRESDGEIWGLMIADASGHGAAAAVEIAMFDAVLRTYKPTDEEFTGPGDVLTYANRYFFTRMLRGSFITAFVSNYDPASRTLNYAIAGHPPPFIKRKHGAGLVSLQSQAGLPLGVDELAVWHSASETMLPGDLLVMYTDGIIEARSGSGEEFGAQRLQEVIANSPANADACAKAIEESVARHRGNEPSNDDVTLIVIEITA